ncbi:hypothetical protein Tco_0252849 [Tanacetum coccineum]
MAILSQLKDLEMGQMMMKNPPLEQTGGPKEDGQERNPLLPVLQVKRLPRQQERLPVQDLRLQKSASQSAPVGEAMHSTDIFKGPADQEFETGVQDEQAEEEVQHLPDWFQKPTRLPSPDHAWNTSVPAVHETVQPWSSFPHDLPGQPYRSSNSQGRRVLPISSLINNDLEYLRVCPTRCGVNGVKYGQIRLWGYLAWGMKRRQFYALCNIKGNQLGRYQKDGKLLSTKVGTLSNGNDYRSDWITAGTLDERWTVLNDASGIRLEYLPKTFWSQRDKAKARAKHQSEFIHNEDGNPAGQHLNKAHGRSIHEDSITTAGNPVRSSSQMNLLVTVDPPGFEAFQEWYAACRFRSRKSTRCKVTSWRRDLLGDDSQMLKITMSIQVQEQAKTKNVNDHYNYSLEKDENTS